MIHGCWLHDVSRFLCAFARASRNKCIVSPYKHSTRTVHLNWRIPVLVCVCACVGARRLYGEVVSRPQDSHNPTTVAAVVVGLHVFCSVASSRGCQCSRASASSAVRVRLDAPGSCGGARALWSTPQAATCPPAGSTCPSLPSEITTTTRRSTRSGFLKVPKRLPAVESAAATAAAAHLPLPCVRPGAQPAHVRVPAAARAGHARRRRAPVHSHLRGGEAWLL